MQQGPLDVVDSLCQNPVGLCCCQSGNDAHPTVMTIPFLALTLVGLCTPYHHHHSANASYDYVSSVYLWVQSVASKQACQHTT